MEQNEIQNLDALHPARVAQHLPSAEEQYKELEDVNQFFSDTTRVGAGGVKSGLPGLRLMSAKKSALLHERFTETNKTPKKEAPSHDFREFIGKPPDVPKTKVVALPMNFCPDGGTEGCLRQNIPPGTGQLAISPVGWDMPSIGLKQGDIVRHAVCEACAKEAKRGNATGLQIPIEVSPGVYEQIPYSMIVAVERGKRLARNVETFLREAWTLRKEGIFINEHGEDMARER